MRVGRMEHGSDIQIMPALPNRATHRWTGYDYANVGAYYLTICTRDRSHLFGEIAGHAMHRSSIGEWAQRCWEAIPEHMPHVDVGEFVVMPNHVHGIVVIRERLVDVRGRVLDGGVGVDGVGARHDAPDKNALDAPDTTTNAPDDPGTGMPGDDPDMADVRANHTRARHYDHGAGAHDPHTRARHDAPLRDPRKPPGIPRGALGQIVGSYKSAVTRMLYRDGLLHKGSPVWQRNYWDRVIRDDGEHERIAQYIRANPANWKGDRFNR
ncbi:MAG: transposase [Flavobacteriales bacterium]